VKAGEPSRTAEYMALFRALESVRPPARRLFVDPFARGFLGAPLRFVVDASRVPAVGERVRGFIDRRWPGARTSAVARTRFIDERLGKAVSAGARQIVILGAGFDARAYRLPICRDCAVFEVDHPATQARKRRLLEGALGTVPRNVRFVPVDFDHESLEDRLPAAGYDARERAVFLWEGVTNYLTAHAVDATLRWCARAEPGSRILFTYVHQGVLDEPRAFFGTARLFRSLEAAGERWTFGLDPAHLEKYLQERGLRLVEDRGAADYRAEAYGPEAAAMRGYEFYRIAVAAVAEPTAGGRGPASSS
jgi:methyltransferase (TIGR00027 family)